ncbi:MAG: hypothetical protein KGQ36_02630 [Rickettsiales bacterium]|nr:hypothetical protein [Rickettsiales bacterium]
MHYNVKDLDLIKFAEERKGSIAEFIFAHTKNIKHNPSLKALFTKDKATLQVANKVLKNKKFFKENIL